MNFLVSHISRLLFSRNRVYVLISASLLCALSVSAEATDKLCDPDQPPSVIPAVESSSLEKENPLWMYRGFMADHNGNPPAGQLIAFFRSLSDGIIRHLAERTPSSQELLRHAFLFRLALSEAQVQVCTGPDFLIVYDDFLRGLRQFDLDLTYRPKTLEGFVFQQEAGLRAITQADVDFIDQHMLDTPLNRAIEARILAYSPAPSIKNRSLPSLCRELESLGVKANSIQTAADGGALSVDLTNPGCYDLDQLGDPVLLKLPRAASFFSLLRTNGKNVVVHVTSSALPALDLSSREPATRLPPIEPAVARPITVPVLILLRTEAPDGSALRILERFDAVTTILHLFLTRPEDGPIDDRPIPTAKPGGDGKIVFDTGLQPVSSIAFLSRGQAGGSAAPSLPSEETVVDIDRAMFDRFVENHLQPLVDGLNVLPLPEPNVSQLQAVLTVATDSERTLPDMRVDVPLVWIEQLPDTQKDHLFGHCGDDFETCIMSLVHSRLREVVATIFRDCKGDAPCDLKRLGVGLRSVQPPGNPGFPRVVTPDGDEGTLTIVGPDTEEPSG